MQKNSDNSIWTYLPEGCKLCWEGAKLVLFVTGKCNQNCFYCPISDEKKGKDIVYANEKLVKKPSDAIEEAKLIDAKGAGITGGEPFLVIPKVVKYIKLFKKTFGKNFHIHLYTYGGNVVTKEKIKALEQAGLDEIRFHTPFNIELALNTKIPVGLEVPCIPGTEKYLKSLVDICAEKNIFLNLNEFEFSDTNWERVEAHGFKPREHSYAAVGSRELALKIIRYAEKKKVRIHFCSVRAKNFRQLTERLKRRAKNVRKPYQKINKYGMLEFGLVECSKAEAKKLKLFYTKEGGECSLARVRSLKKYKTWKVTLYPTCDPWVFEKDPLN